MLMKALDKLRAMMGFQFPPLGPLGFRIFRAISVGKKFESRFFHNMIVPVDFSDVIQAAAYWRGNRYEKPTPQMIAHLIKQHQLTCFFDIGANFGFFSYYIKSKFPSIEVFSFEPGPANFSKMEQVKEMNQLGGFTPQNLGLGDTNGRLSFNLTLTDSGHSSFGKNPLYANSPSSVREIEVPVRRFDDWRDEVGVNLPLTSSWIAKMDVEGFELKALQGMTRTLEAKAFKALCIEINYHTLEFFHIKATDLYEFMRSFGYEAFDEDLRPTKPLEKNELRNVFFMLP
jgi:FkbM family methyltransferase